MLVATAHLGNWELSAFAHALMTETMGVMVRPLDNPKVNALVESRRRQSGNKVIGKKETARALIRSLHDNEAVGILIDQNTLPAEGVFIDFFGEKACASSAFAKLAAHTGATVIPGFAFWENEHRSYVLRFYPAIPITGDAMADTQPSTRSSNPLSGNTPTNGCGFIGAGNRGPRALRRFTKCHAHFLVNRPELAGAEMKRLVSAVTRNTSSGRALSSQTVRRRLLLQRRLASSLAL